MWILIFLFFILIFLIFFERLNQLLTGWNVVCSIDLEYNLLIKIISIWSSNLRLNLRLKIFISFSFRVLI